MEYNRLLSQIQPVIQQVLHDASAELFDITLKKSGKGIILSILADTDKGITVGECAAINSRISGIIESKSIISEKYIVEVSSPGLDRPLKAERDFKKALDDMVEVQLSSAKDNRSLVRGVVKTVDAKGIEIEEKNHNNLFLPYRIILRAKRVL
jgi:ribosome maturation factor RimP